MISKKEIITSIEEAFDPDDWQALKVNPQMIIHFLKHLLKKRKIFDWRFLPIYDGDNLEKVHVIFVSQFFVFYVYLSNGIFEFRDIPIYKFNLKTRVLFESGKQINKFLLECDIGDTNSEGMPILHQVEIPDKIQNRVVALIALIVTLKEDYYNNEH